MGRSKNLSVNRRNFLKGAATAGAAALVSPAGPAQGKEDESGVAKKGDPERLEVLVTDHPGSDFMVDAIKSLGIEYVCSMPADIFRGLHESVVNYGGNQNPEFITCCNEESSVSMAHGYFNVEGKPLCIFAHCTVGLQHSAMAIADASFDHVPIYIILGDIRVVANNELTHGVGDEVRMVRDYTKWDDFPLSLEQFAKSAVHAYEIAMTPPRGPVILVADEELQEEPIPQGKKLSIPKVNIRATLVDAGAVTEAARLLVEADLPVIIAGHAARSQSGVDGLVELAEALQAPFLERGGRMNIPSQHPLNQSSPLRSPIPEADVILGFELGGQTGWWSIVHSFAGQRRLEKPAVKAGVKLINVSANNLYIRPNPKEAQRYVPLDVDIISDTEVALPFLIEEVKRLITPSRKSAYQDRGAKFAAARRQGFQLDLDEAAYAWDASPISVARMCAEVWEQIKHEDWSVGAVNTAPVSAWPLRLWTIDKYYQYIGSSGGGVGINAPTAVGAALANRKHGRLTVTFNGDGDMMVAPGVLWTAAHHHIPLLTIMHNNRAYQAEVMAQQIMACRHNRGIERARIGTTLDSPNIDFAKLAQSFGMYAEGPITDPKDLGPALKRAIAVVKRGEPALVDVVTQPR